MAKANETSGKKNRPKAQPSRENISRAKQRKQKLTNIRLVKQLNKGLLSSRGKETNKKLGKGGIMKLLQDAGYKF